ncbi:transcriptional regulator family: Fungal Specific TF [Penicillium argentinense]|uniref:Transcriptional regulator family: Fungal Specific TF n=1 Tax=Penicillium argentinense TaxID=1131581 RepID=A0A9W9FPD0_9EURO|nr:transcriptional regulator family: Fungal Specific TF [Penicillium argentinense]KAJ5103917.1 transcriptional regulator family: Fungal Specific TF [Penicillium argentinense]
MDPTAPRGKTPSQSKSSKVKSACDLCRLRKIRCDRATPACETCTLAFLPCTFTPPSTQNRKGLRQELVDSQARIQQLEDSLAALQKSAQSTPGRSDEPTGGIISAPALLSSSTSPASHSLVPCDSVPIGLVTDTHCLDTALASFKWHMAYCGLGKSLSTTRAAFYSSIYQRTGYTFDLDDFLNELAQPLIAQGLEGARRSKTVKWPPLSLVQQCVKYYAKCGLYTLFPFADSAALQVLVNADVLNRPETSRAANRACLAAFTANITQMHRHDPQFRDTDPDAYAHAALTLLPAMLTEPPDLRTLEAIMMLKFIAHTLQAIFICPLGQPQYAEMLLGMAVQVLYNLGGHKVRPQQNNHLRVMFWIVYGMDREFATRKSQPPLINDAECDLDLPAAYARKPSEHHIFWRPLSSIKELLYPSDLRLSLIKSRIHKLLYSVQSQEYSEAKRLQHIRELDHQLSDLKAEYPVECRPDAFATESAPDYLFHDLSIRGVSVHLEYYYCLGKIHGASNTAQIPSSKSLSPLPSSSEICYEAARSTLIYLGRVRHYINYHTFWIHAQFVLTAVLTLFRFLITLPTAPTFTRDIQILEQTASIFAPARQTDEDGNFFPPFHFTHELIMKFAYLAKQAHIKAIEE